MIMKNKKWSEPKGKNFHDKPQSTINVAGGTAHYVLTETEDSRGRWNDDYTIRNGFYVIHEGRNHHVYKLDK